MFFSRLGKWVSDHWIAVLLAWIVAVPVVHHFAPSWDEITHDGDFAYLPDRMTSVRGAKLLEAAFPDFYSKSQLALVIAREDGRLTESDLEVADLFLAAFPPAASPTPEAKAESENPSNDQKSSKKTQENPSNDQKSSKKTPDMAKVYPAAVADSDNPITAVWDYETPVIGRKLMSQPGEHGQAALAVFHLRNEFMAVGNMDLLRRMYRKLAELRRAGDYPNGLKLGLTGSAAIGSDMLFAAQESIRNTELTTILLVALILLLVYRSPGLVLVPLLTIGASVWLAMDLVAIAARLSEQLSWLDFKIFKTTRIFIVVLLFGAGTDFCLFLISRYKEELESGLDRPQAVAAALRHVGSALAASALTTIFGLAMMVFADFGKFRNSGPAIALCLLVTLVACVTLAPALLRAGGRAVFWPFGGDRGKQTEKQTSGQRRLGPRARWTGPFWERISRAIIARPGLILALSLLVLLPFTRPLRMAVLGLWTGDWSGVATRVGAPVTYDFLAELGPTRPSVQGAHLLWGYFPADQTGPLTILVNQPGVDFRDQNGRRKIAELTKELFELEQTDQAGKTIRPLVGVRSLTEPMGDAPGSFNPLSAAGRRKLVTLHHPRTLATFVSQTPPLAGRVIRLDVISIYAPFSKESVALFEQIEKFLRDKFAKSDSDWRGAEVDFVGTTAGIRDLERVTSSDRLRIELLVVIAVLAVLVVILRRPLVCLYLILSVLLGYYVTIGATELLFSWLHGAAFTGLDWKVPIFLFVILVAVGQDYNIYLVTRVFEEQQRLGPIEGLREAVARTGGIITSCGVIMAGTFISMAAGTLHAMQELGFALALGVLLDTFVIRTILVPAFLALLARRQ